MLAKLLSMFPKVSCFVLGHADLRHRLTMDCKCGRLLCGDDVIGYWHSDLRGSIGHDPTPTTQIVCTRCWAVISNIR